MRSTAGAHRDAPSVVREPPLPEYADRFQVYILFNTAWQMYQMSNRQAQFCATHQEGSEKEPNMNATIRSIEKDMKVRLSTLWIFAMFNYLYADVMSLTDPRSREMVTTGSAGSLQITEGFLLGAAILMETAIAMVLLSRVLPYAANRWANIIVGVIQTAAVLSSLFIGTTLTVYYLFFASIEIVCTCVIIWYAWRWANPEGAVLTATK
jgi:Family of unknown function (DUF6326)